MRSVLVVAHHERPDAWQLARDAASWLLELGVEAWMVPDEAAASTLGELAADRDPADASLVLSLGGDGTMLRAVALLDGAPVPLLGVNLGRLGYLTEIEPDELHGSLHRFLDGADAGAWRIDERMMLDVTVRHADGTASGPWRALNEAVIEKRESGHTVNLLMRIDAEPFTSYAADGLIVSTPTGSTAYSLSARGPVVSPKHRALLVTPVAPHQLFDRSLVLDPNEVVEVEVLPGRDAAVVIDGQSRGELTAGAVVRCLPSDRTARFVRFGDRHYHQVLKAKFGLLDR